MTLVPNLAAGRLLLRPVQPEDVAAFQAVMSDPEMALHTDVPGRPTVKTATRVITWMCGLNTRGRGRAWAITLNSELAGFVRINRIDKKSATGVIGYEVARPFWGKGIATTAVRAVVEHGHGDLGLHRLEAWTLNGNPASDRVLEKLGFRIEGIQRDKVVLHGQRRDQHLYARLAQDLL